MSKTTDNFAAARAAIERRRAQLTVDYEAEVAALEGHLTALLIAEQTIGVIAEWYPGTTEVPVLRKEKRAAKREPNKRYTLEEEARILAAGRGELKQLAAEMPGRTYSGVLKKHEELISRREKAAAEDAFNDILSPPPFVEDTPVPANPDPLDEIAAQRRFDPDYVPDKDAQLGHYSWRPLEARTRGAAVPQSSTPPRRPEAPKPKPSGPVRDVSGRLIGNGPGDDRVYDHPDAFRSRNSE